MLFPKKSNMHLLKEKRQSLFKKRTASKIAKRDISIFGGPGSGRYPKGSGENPQASKRDKERNEIMKEVIALEDERNNYIKGKSDEVYLKGLRTENQDKIDAGTRKNNFPKDEEENLRYVINKLATDPPFDYDDVKPGYTLDDIKIEGLNGKSYDAVIEINDVESKGWGRGPEIEGYEVEDVDYSIIGVFTDKGGKELSWEGDVDSKELRKDIDKKVESAEKEAKNTYRTSDGQTFEEVRDNLMNEFHKI